MNTLEVSPLHRLLSRIAFYCLVAVMMWSANRLLPDRPSYDPAFWSAPGTAQPLIAVPISELSRYRTPDGTAR